MPDTLLGFVLATAAAIFFALSSILFRIGQREDAEDDGHALSLAVNVVVFGLAALFVTWPGWTWPGAIALFAGGIVGSVLGRATSLRAIRLIGPTRSGTLLTAVPLAAAIVGWIVLGERLSVVEAIGGAVILAGLVRLVRARAQPETASAAPPPRWAYLIAALAPLFFGTAFVIRKWGLGEMPGALTGAFLGAVAGFTLVAVIDTARGVMVRRVRRYIADPPWAFLGAGLATCAALLSQFSALSRIPAWVTGILQGTQVIWTIVLSVMILGKEENIDRQLLINVGLVVVGVFVIAIA